MFYQIIARYFEKYTRDTRDIAPVEVGNVIRIEIVKYLLVHQTWIQVRKFEVQNASMNDLQKLTTDKTNIDGIQMVVLAHMLQRKITVVHMEGFWSTDANMATDIVIVYTGLPQKLFFPTQVGN